MFHDVSCSNYAEKTQKRITLIRLVMIFLFLSIQGRLVFLGFQPEKQVVHQLNIDRNLAASRPRLLDRNGEILALDIPMQSLFAEPRKIEHPNEIYKALITVLPDLNYDIIIKRLSSDVAFAWIQREITPRQQSEVLALGLPGIGFKEESKRYYPSAAIASHILGHTNIDNQGIAGIEKHLDDVWLRDFQNSGLLLKKEIESVYLSIDLRVQYFVRNALSQAMEKYNAIGAAGVVLNVQTGEIMALSSLPDYNPNDAVGSLQKDRLNRISTGTYEMGSTFKTFTTAMALDSGEVNLQSRFDVSKPLRIGRFTIHDFHGKHRILSVPEIYIYSSNIGTAKMAHVVGIDQHRQFLSKLGLLDRMSSFELPGTASPNVPRIWKKVHSTTISYGHGLSTTPLQTAVAAAALVNGGKLIPPTLFPRSQDQADKIAKQVVHPKTSEIMRYLMRLNVLKGSGKNAEVPGYLVGGKTGTAEKVVRGRYSKDKRFNAFLATFPVNSPRYIVLVIIDEPKPEQGKRDATAASNAAPVVSNIINRSAIFLDIMPDFRVSETAGFSLDHPIKASRW